MSVLHVRQIGARIRELFEAHLNLSDISPNDAERDLKVLTRCLAAYAVYSITGCTEVEAAGAVVDGGDDNGLDAIYYSPSTREMILVQSKWISDGQGEPDSASILKFCTGIRDLFDLNFDRFNAKVSKRQTEIESALEEYDTRYHVVVIDTGDRGLAQHAKRHIDDLVSELNDAGEGTDVPLVTDHRLNQARIHSSLSKTTGAAIDLDLCLYSWGKIDQPYAAFYGLVSIEEIARWWVDHNRRLFERNIRQVLGVTDINAEIRAWLESNPELFVYFNNGITIVADSVTKAAVGGANRDSGTFHLVNAQVVNGAQTVSSIGEYCSRQKAGIPEARVFVRAISLRESPEDFGTHVTRANNRQNRIENRDFASQDPQQIRIKGELVLEGIDYSIARSDSYKPTDTAFDILESTIALACASNKTELVVQAKREIGKYFENLEGGIYKSLFNPATSGDYVWNCVRAVRAIEKGLKTKIKSLPRRSGRSYGLLVHGNRLIAMLALRDARLRSAIRQPVFEVDQVIVEQVLSNVITAVEAALASEFGDSMLGTLFKNASKCKQIVAKVPNSVPNASGTAMPLFPQENE